MTGPQESNPGVVVATVKEIDAELGQVKVLYPWRPGTQLSPWAPVVAPMAGPKRGQLFMPEVDDMALVAFDHGDFDHPYVIGFFWTGVQKSPDTEKTHRVIVTPGGHELRFEDTNGEKRVVLKSKAGHQVELSDKDSKVTVKTNGGQSMVLSDGDSSIELKGGGRTVAMRSGKVQIS